MTATLDAPTAVADELVVGRTTPRLFTPPAVTGEAGPCGCGCALTPATSLGFQAITFATEVVGVSLLPWQRWWLIHALELNPDGSFRFSTVLTLVSRQNGKTTLLKIVALWFLYLGHGRLVLGAAQALNIAKESWEGAIALAESVPDLADEIAAVSTANSGPRFVLENGARYQITAASRGAGRGLSVDLLILDELREHRNTEAWAALGNTTMARPNALTVCISNQGDAESVVLNTLRASALAGADPRVGLFEWSAPDLCELDDVDAWAQANPGLGRTVTAAKLRTMLATTSPTDFRTENLCQRVDSLDAAIDPAAWSACHDSSGTLAAVRPRITLCVDVAPDGKHVTAALAARLDDGSVRVEIAGAWESTDAARKALLVLCGKLRPRALGWYPAGPAAVLAPDLAALHGSAAGRRLPDWSGFYDHSPGVVEISGPAVAASCMTFADLVDGRRLRHPDDPLLNAHVAGAQRGQVADGWRFVRRGVGNVDAAYAAAGAAHLALTLPAPAPVDRPKVF